MPPLKCTELLSIAQRSAGARSVSVNGALPCDRTLRRLRQRCRIAHVTFRTRLTTRLCLLTRPTVASFFLFPSRDADLSSAVVVLSASVFSLASLSSSSSSSYYQFFSRSVQHRFFARVFLSTALLTVNEIVDENYIASKKQNTKLLPTTSPNINRFSFFH